MLIEPSLTSLKAHVWKLKCPSKIKHFLWQTISGSIAVRATISQRGVNCSTICKGCEVEEETINHALFECHAAKQVWDLFLSLQGRETMPMASIYANLDYLFWRMEGGDTIKGETTMFPWILWYIWKSRNKKCFQGMGSEPADVLALAEKEYSGWTDAQIRTTEELTMVVEPENVGHPRIQICCKVDGSWKDSELTSGLGWVCYQGNQNLLVGAKGMSQRRSALHSEMEALLWALECLQERGLECQVFETDSSELVDIIRNPEEWPVFSIQSEKLRTSAARLPSFTISKISRSVNVQADCLARSARLRNAEFSFVNNLPPSWVTTNEGFA